tara:strand:+ start:108 stop:626 length:519 start_codon:yes stop_codon:yes gene_type:complete
MRNLKNEKIGILTVLYKTEKTKYKKQSPVWMCECECGNQKEYSSTELQCGVQSCGCLRQKNLDTFGDRWKGVAPPCTKLPGESTKRAIYSTYVGGARRRDIDFQLDESHFRKLIGQNCFYCGDEPSQIKKDRRRKSGDVTMELTDKTMKLGIQKKIVFLVVKSATVQKIPCL